MRGLFDEAYSNVSRKQPGVSKFMHDFRQLSPLDFENLVRDLLQEEIKLRIESFGPGSDGGIDFRFAKAGKTTVIQVKHYLDTPTRGLLRAIAIENAKVAKLKPDRYILATSARLNPALKDKIIDAMPDAALSREDVLGREDINNLLERQPKVLRQHFKLWLTHVDTLERIIHSGIYNRTDAELELIKDLVPRIVQNESIAAAEAILERRGTLIIAGEPGVGKTTLARVLTWMHLAQDWRVFVVDDLKEAMEVCTPGEKRLIFLDDFLGQISLTNDAIRNVDQRLPIFLDRIRTNKDLRFILTTRSYLLTQAQLQSERLASEKVSASELVLNVGAYTRTIKAQIVFNHIYFSTLSTDEKKALLRESFYLKMIDHPNFSPRLIDLLTSADYLTLQNIPIQDVVLNVLDNPSALWETPYRSHLSEESRFVMLALFFRDSYTTLEKLTESYKRLLGASTHPVTDSVAIVSFRQALKPLEGSIASLANGYVYFNNPGLKDFLSNVIISDLLLPSVLAAVGTLEELNNIWNFFRRNHKVCSSQIPNEEAWSAALERITYIGKAPAIAIVNSGLEMCASLHSNEKMFSVISKALKTLDNDPINAGDEMYCRHALERYQDLSLEDQQNLLGSEILVEATAEMLSSSGDELSIEDIGAIAQAIDVYGEAPNAASTAAAAAMRGFLGELTDRLWDVTSSDELDIFEHELISALKQFDVPFETWMETKIQEHRDYLIEKESEPSEEGYTPVARPLKTPEVSDTDIQSLFVTLINYGVAE